MELSIIIVNYRQSRELRHSLGSLKSAMGDLSFEVRVIDNSGGDDGLEVLRQEFPEVHFTINRTNVGFARANNQGAQTAEGRHLLFLNPDTELGPGSLPLLVRYLDTHPDTGVVAPKVLNPDGTIQYSCRRFPSMWAGLFNRYSVLTRLFPDNPFSTDYLMRDFDHNHLRDVDWVSGCCMMVPRDVFFRVGSFDENYFLFNEDVDFCKSVHHAGLRVVYFPEARVIHQISSSNGKMPPRIIIRRHRGMSYYQKKHMGYGIFTEWMVDVMIGVRCFSQLLLNVFRS